MSLAGRRALLVALAVLLASLVAAAALLVADGAGWMGELGPPPHFRPLLDDRGEPLTDAAGRVLFGIEPAAARLHGDPARDRLWLAREKDPGALRILSIGESTTYGAGYDGRASYSRYLEARLRRRLGRDSIEVVNCGKNGYDSHDWPTLAPELARFSPDLLVLYVGHNELKKPNLLGVIDPAKAARRDSKLARLLLGEPEDDVVDPPSVRAGALLAAEQRERALAQFETGVRALLEAARSMRIPAVICRPAANVLDHAPRLSILDAGADEAALERVRTLASAWERGDLPDLASGPEDARAAATVELRGLEDALAEHAGAAILHFRRARLLLALGRLEEARAGFHRAHELDGLPEQAPPDFVARLAALADESGAPVADAAARIERDSERGVAGFDRFIDYCHPNLLGHWQIADEILRVIESRGLLAPATEFDDSREPPEPGRFAAYNALLGIDEASIASVSVDKAKLKIGEQGTRPDPPPEPWAIAEEFLDAAARQDVALAGRAEWMTLKAVCRAGRGDGGQARRLLEDARRADPARLADLARAMAVLPGLVAAFASAGVTLTPEGFTWGKSP